MMRENGEEPPQRRLLGPPLFEIDSGRQSKPLVIRPRSCSKTDTSLTDMSERG